jgi:hypothetical protein
MNFFSSHASNGCTNECVDISKCKQEPVYALAVVQPPVTLSLLSGKSKLNHHCAALTPLLLQHVVLLVSAKLTQLLAVDITAVYAMYLFANK